MVPCFEKTNMHARFTLSFQTTAYIRIHNLHTLFAVKFENKFSLSLENIWLLKQLIRSAACVQLVFLAYLDKNQTNASTSW